MRQPGRPWGIACGVLVCCVFASAVGQDALKGQIDHAIARGVAYLRKGPGKNPGPNGAWRQAGVLGPAALVSWTLLECGQPPTEPAIRKALTAIRQAAITETANYSISLDIFLFDKLADPEDIPLIESLGLRLLGSQTADGGWSYQSDAPSAAELKRLSDLVNARKGPTMTVGKRPGQPRKFEQLSEEIQQQLKALAKRRLPAGHPALQNGGDHSNTQFAALGLWVARRYGLPVDQALGRPGQRFVRYQAPDGSWTYTPQELVKPAPGKPSQAMTCAGLLGLALAHATVDDSKGGKAAQLRSASVRAGLAHLGRVMRGEVPASPQFGYYFLWSLERMAVAYNLKTIDGIDWYAWGAERLLKSQASDGGWKQGVYGVNGIDTCFALLFLKRVNIAPDLTEVIGTGGILEAPEAPPKKKKR